ncbi:GmrSD restriction endonuclease domain-containing protein [Vibrio tapetis]|uniref:DUF262 domain-containing protein n=1 Tax=Vibrio tapetis subsp. tapetis TaxID=1671868 RepID=A0A2N8Z9F1_9VIBR|nr:protein of unknown function [Vibrio tapetis subsp. tapetis]
MMGDIKSCIERLREYEDSVTFIGTVITVANNEGVAAKKELKNELPTKVHHVIDGQQRLTSYSLILMAYYTVLEDINTRYKREVEPDICTTLKRWVNSKVSELQKTIKNSISIEMGDDGDVDAGYNFYPKITRANEDAWSKFEEDAQYESPVASFMHKFIRHYITKVDSTFDPKVFSKKNDLHSIVADNFETLCFELKELAADDDLIPSSETPYSKLMLERFLNVNSDLSDDIDKDELEKCSDIIRVVMLGNFILKRVVATFVEVSDDNYAFDMFEALNTTGEPLTAFETFKPKVVEYCQKQYDKDYNKTEEAKILCITEELLSKYKKAEDKHRKTTALFQAFSIAYEGNSLGGHLSVQRRYINDAFDSTKDKKSFLMLMSACCEFISEVWESPQPSILETVNCSSKELMILMSHPDIDKANFCIKALKSANHKIVCGLLASFYYQFKSSNYNYEKLDEYIKAILCTTAFFVRYRSFTHGTDAIDTKYREIMSDGLAKNSVPFRSVSQLKDLMSLKLTVSDRNGKDAWLHAVKTQDLYKNRKDLSKLMLLISFENSVCDLGNEGHLTQGTSSLSSYLNLNVWTEFNSVEHVWPQNSCGNWDSQLDPERHLNSLGNLSMLPGKENTIAGNKNWDEKKTIYQILSESNAAAKELLITEAVSQKILTANQGNILKNESKLHPHIVAISRCADWTSEYVEQRSINLLERVWDKTVDWMN